MTPGIFLLIAGLALGFNLVLARRFPAIWLGLSVVAAGAGLGAALEVLTGGSAWEWRSAFSLGGEPLHFRLDGLSALFLTLVAVASGAGAVYVRDYWWDGEQKRSAPRSRLWSSILTLSMGLVLLAANGLHFLIAWEAFAIAGYFLITLDRDRPAVRQAGWLYLGASHAGTMGLFAFFALLAAKTGSWELGPLRDHPELAPLFWLALFGFGVKAGFFPLHIWLPSAHANAPSHVSAVMSGVAIKMGLYGIVRFSGWLPVPAAAGWVVTGLGATSALVGIAFAFAQNDYKRLLAYCSVENMGIILTGVGIALLAVTHGNAPWGRLALAGALLHVWNHGAFKSLLFFGAGSVLHGTGTREMSRLGGLWKRLPVTAGLFALGSVAVAGLPPFNGFVSEWLIYLGLLETTTSKGPAAWAAMPAMIFLAVAGALAVAAFAKANALIFLGAARTQPAARAHECGPWMRTPMWLLAGLCLALGLAPVLVWPAIAHAVGAWQPEWNSPELPAPLLRLGTVQIALVLLIAIAALMLWRRAHREAAQRGLTWDCGYATPTARMQYSGGSFAGIATGWFRGVLQPERKLRRPHGQFPSAALRLERIPETVLEYALTPAANLILQISTTVRRLQHGRLQFYLLYVVAGLVAMGFLVWWGGSL